MEQPSTFYASYRHFQHELKPGHIHNITNTISAYEQCVGHSSSHLADSAGDCPGLDAFLVLATV